MASIEIRLNTLGKVKEFNAIAQQMTDDVDLRSGRYCVDAKSVMGIFSLNLEQTLIAESSTVDETELKVLFADFLAE